MLMQVLYTARKDRRNQEKHGFSLSRAADFDFETANYSVDDREDYGEVRYKALGFLDARLCLLVFTEAGEGAIRAISLRKANRDERKEYAES